MTEPLLAARKSGLRRRGHLLRALRALANDPEATPKQRLEACKMLFALETGQERKDLESPPTPQISSRLQALLDKMEEPALPGTSGLA